MHSIFNEEDSRLVAYYMLPLVQLSYRAFGPYFKRALINRDHNVIRVEMSEGCAEPFWENKFYQTDYSAKGTVYAFFRFPDMLRADVNIFASGKYSDMSKKAKERIYKHSGLYYNKQIDNLIVSDVRLLALSKSRKLKDWVEETFGVKKGKNTEFIKLKNKESIYYD